MRCVRTNIPFVRLWKFLESKTMGKFPRRCGASHNDERKVETLMMHRRV
ncbi:hypothetical protein [Mastigocoleus testarum]|nr:hypothetical protein [Mastigocoleus testarum]